MCQRAFTMTLNGRWEVSIELDSRLNAAFAKQLERLAQSPHEPLAMRKLTQSVVGAIERSLDADLKAPTSTQLRLAMAIAQDLNVPLPAEVLRFRGDAEMFIDIAVADTKPRSSPTPPSCERA